MKYKFEIVAFFCGLVGMVIELAGSRFLAPFFGTSIFVWTSLIGIILASLSLGYYIGGKMTPAGPSEKKLSEILMVATIFSSTILIIEPFISFLAIMHLDLRVSAFIASIFLFAPVTILLGMVTPYIARLKIKESHEVGSAIGNLYSASTVGSIVGTFLGGFVLISFFGTRLIFVFVTIILFALYVLVIATSKIKINGTRFYIFLVIFGTMLTAWHMSYANSPYIADIDTSYNKWLVYNATDVKSGVETRILMNGVGGEQSGVAIAEPTTLIFSYLKAFDRAALLAPSTKTTLLIGAGGYTYPTHFLSEHKDSTMDVVEIDPKVKGIARDYFFFKDDSRVTTFDEDGRIFLNSNQKKYDVIFVDAFGSNNTIPYHLTTIETAKKIKNSLNQNGMVIINIISSVTGNNSDFLNAEYKTYAAVFPKVVVFPAIENAAPTARQNIILFATASSTMNTSAITNAVNNSVFQNNVSILTDDFAPVERYTSTF